MGVRVKLWHQRRASGLPGLQAGDNWQSHSRCRLSAPQEGLTLTIGLTGFMKACSTHVGLMLCVLCVRQAVLMHTLLQRMWSTGELLTVNDSEPTHVMHDESASKVHKALNNLRVYRNCLESLHCLPGASIHSA